jgi:hypothetical protein
MANFSNHKIILTLLSVLVLASSFGCGLGAAREKAPSWDPVELTNKAFSLFDSNGDAELDSKELKAAPGLGSSIKAIDTNSDGKMSRSELESRFALYKSGKVALQSVTFQVLYKNRPLEEGSVRMIPEPFLEGLCEPAEGMIFGGATTPTIVGQKLPAMRLGFYRIEVTSDAKKIPAKYNTETTLGMEVSPVSDGPDSYGAKTFNLK